MNFNFERNRETVVIVVIVLISLFFAKKAHDANTSKCAQLQEQIKTEEEKAQALDRIVRVNENLKKIQEKGWDTTNFELVVQRVSELGEAAGIKIATIMPSTKKTQDDYTAIPFSLNGETTYRNLEKFINSLAKEKKLLRIREITLYPSSGEAGADQDISLSVALTGEALYFK